jgi:hypothetical protein
MESKELVTRSTCAKGVLQTLCLTQTIWNQFCLLVLISRPTTDLSILDTSQELLLVLKSNAQLELTGQDISVQLVKPAQLVSTAPTLEWHQLTLSLVMEDILARVVLQFQIQLVLEALCVQLVTTAQ